MSEVPPDNKLFRPMLILGIVVIILGILMATGSYYSGPYIETTVLVAGIGFIILGVMCIIFYVIKPEPLRQKYIENWRKKQARKRTRKRRPDLIERKKK